MSSGLLGPFEHAYVSARRLRPMDVPSMRSAQSAALSAANRGAAVAADGNPDTARRRGRTYSRTRARSGAGVGAAASSSAPALRPIRLCVGTRAGALDAPAPPTSTHPERLRPAAPAKPAGGAGWLRRRLRYPARARPRRPGLREQISGERRRDGPVATVYAARADIGT
jgi:hypothetical protein